MLSEENDEEPFRRLYIVRSRGPAPRGRRPDHPKDAVLRVGGEHANEHCSVSYIDIIQQYQEDDAKTRARALGRSRGPCALRRRSARCATRPAGARQCGQATVVETGARNSKPQRRLGGLVERAAGAAHALDGRIGDVRATGAARAGAAGAAAACWSARERRALAQGVGESRSHASRRQRLCPRSKVSLCKTRFPRARRARIGVRQARPGRHGGVGGLRYWAR